VVFYLNRFWNIARLATKNFDEMTKEDVQRLVMRSENSGRGTVNHSPIAQQPIIYWRLRHSGNG